MANIAGRNSGSEASFAPSVIKLGTVSVVQINLTVGVLSSIKFFLSCPMNKGDRCMAIAHRVVSGRLANFSTRRPTRQRGLGVGRKRSPLTHLRLSA
jgi:hypothetical protein